MSRSPLARQAPLLVIAVALAGCLALLAGQFNPYLGDYGDDAEFLILGQSLSTGQGYAWINSPEHPAHNRYPPGYPTLLAVTALVSRTAGQAFEAIVPAKVATIATFLASVALLWPIARRRLPPGLAAGAVAVYALNPFAIRFAGQVMSDVPYIAAELAALAWADRFKPAQGATCKAQSPRRAGQAAWRMWRNDWVILGVLLALGAYVRTVGNAAALGVLAWAWSRNRRGGAIAAAVFLAVITPWWVRDVTLAGGWRYFEELRSASYLNPAAGTIDASGLAERAIGNAGFVLGKPGTLGVAGVAGAVLAGALLFAGYWRAVRTMGGAAEWVVVPLVLAVLVWPIRTGRYLLPVIPLAGIYAIEGARIATRLWETRFGYASRVRGDGRGITDSGSSKATALLAVGIGAFCLIEAAWGGREALGNLRALSRGAGPASYYRDRPDWQRYLEAAAWLYSNAGPDDVALSRRHFALYVYSGHYTDKYRYDTSKEELDYLTGGSARKFVVEDSFEVLRGDFRPLPAALRARGDDLRLRFESGPPQVRVWELVRHRT